MGLTEALAAAAPLVNTAAQSGISVWAQKKNEALTREAWARDDSSIQRRVADLRAAGLSPVLAAGTGAGNTSPIAVTRPNIDIGNPVGEYQKSKAATADLINAGLTKSVLEAQYDKTKNESYESMARQQLLYTQAGLAADQAEEVRQRVAERAYNLGKAQELGIRSDITGGLQGQLQQGVGFVDQILELLQRAGITGQAKKDQITK